MGRAAVLALGQETIAMTPASSNTHLIQGMFIGSVFKGLLSPALSTPPHHSLSVH